MNIRTLLYLLFIAILWSCGTTERVITDDGKVYEIKGNKFFNNGEEITEQLSSDEKDAIKTTLDDRLKAEKLIEDQREQLEDEQKRLEKAQKEARRTQKELEKKQERIEDNRKEKETARIDFLETKDKLQKKKERFQKLQQKGKLSPNAIENWEERIKDLEEDLEKAEKRLNSLK